MFFFASHNLTLMCRALLYCPPPFYLQIFQSNVESMERTHRNIYNDLVIIHIERPIQNMNCNLGIFKKKIKNFTAGNFVKRLVWISGAFKFYYNYHEHRNKSQIRLKKWVMYIIFIYEILYFQAECKKK